MNLLTPTLVTFTQEESPHYYNALCQLRRRVYEEEQGIPVPANHYTQMDARAMFMGFLADDGQGFLAVGGLLPQAYTPLFGAGTAQIISMAVDPNARGTGLGRKILAALESLAWRSDGVIDVCLMAQEQAVGFYAQADFCVVGEPTDVYGVPHCWMIKQAP
jgi:predicted GNAT family N-acyltransferase